MPRAFLITRRRYNGTEQFEEETMRDCSPERGVSVAEYGSGQPTSDGVSDCGSETSSECPEELYNLTKLAEVSLAAAAGTLIHPGKVIYQRTSSSPSRYDGVDNIDRYESAKEPRAYEINEDFEKRTTNDEQVLQERTRLFFERIEAERKILERRSPPPNDAESQRVLRLTAREPSPQRAATRHRHHHRVHQPEARKMTRTPTTTPDSASNENSRKNPPMHGVESGKSDDSEDHECPDCGKRYSTSSNLARHRQTHRSLGDKKARRCPHCDKVYVSMPAFSMHVRTHNQGCKCHYCGKCFSRPWLLQGHIRTHTGEKPFKCTICNKAFADKSNLRAHIQTHSNTKPHVCGRCGKAFALKSYLYKHEESSCMRAHHRASSEKRETEPGSPLPRRISVPVTASPTSVIVPRLGLGRSISVGSEPFSAIRHTKTSEPSRISPPTITPLANHDEHPRIDGYPKRPLSEVISDHVVAPNPDARVVKRRLDVPSLDASEYRSQMVIRTSVISPNPEHLGRLTSNGVKNKSSFELASSRNSAFSRPGMTLNLAIA